MTAGEQARGAEDRAGPGRGPHRSFAMRRPAGGRRPGPAALVASAITGAFVLFLVQALVLPTGWFVVGPDEPGPAQERIQWVATAPATPEAPVAERPGGDGRPLREGARSSPLVAPTETPGGIPAPPAGDEGAAREGGTGDVVGGGGPAAGLRPRYTDPRLWTGVVPPPRLPGVYTTPEQLDSIVVADIAADQAMRGPPGRDPGDWTFERNGLKYGIDRKYIRLGKFSIPTAVLGLLPLNNAQANPVELERERRLAGMRAEIQWQAQRALNEEDFRTRINLIRERKDRERAERLAREKAAEEQETTAAPR